eukprot:184776-Chlamydomonas_euryale.AAC.3
MFDPSKPGGTPDKPQGEALGRGPSWSMPVLGSLSSWTFSRLKQLTSAALRYASFTQPRAQTAGHWLETRLGHACACAVDINSKACRCGTRVVPAVGVHAVCEASAGRSSRTVGGFTNAVHPAQCSAS